jgi:hypothetical protein
MMRFFVALAMAGTSLAGTAAASDLVPGNGYSLHLGGYNGALYYTTGDDGFRVVATLASGEVAPIRLISTLTPGQSVTLSVPRGLGEPPATLVIWREGDTLRFEGANSAATSTDPGAPLQAALTEELRGR